MKSLKVFVASDLCLICLKRVSGSHLKCRLKGNITVSESALIGLKDYTQEERLM